MLATKQPAEARPLPTRSEAQGTVIAEVPEFRPLAAPWQIRFQKHIIAGTAVAAIIGLTALGIHVWRSFGPSPLDVVEVEAPAPIIPRQDAPPAPVRAAPAPPAVVDVPQKRSEPPRSRGAITHTRRADSVASAPATARPSPQPQPVECSEAVAALGLCASTVSSKAAQ